MQAGDPVRAARHRIDRVERGKDIERGVDLFAVGGEMGGQIGSDIKVWRDLSDNADEAKLDEDARRSLEFSRFVLG